MSFTAINIEIHLAYMRTWADRSTFYVSKLLVEQVDINKNYSNIKKCINISLLDFNYIKETDRFHTVYHLREDTENIKYTDILEIHVVELPKLPQKDDGTDLYDWVRFIKAENKGEFEMLAKQNTYLSKAYETLEEISADRQKRLEYDARQKALYDYNTMMIESHERGRIEGKAEGRAEGKAERDMELKEKMRTAGINEELIKQVFGDV